MAILDGWENLQPHKIVGGRILVELDGRVAEMETYVGPGGQVFAKPVPVVPIDQIGERKSTPVSERWSGVDQL